MPLERETVPPGHVHPPLAAWRGLGAWNAYFIGKMILYATGSLNLDVFYNVLFAAFLLLPLRPDWLHRARRIVAVPIGIALLYHDTWYPPFSRLTGRSEVLQFSFSYIVELLGRFIDWDMVGAGLIFLVAYLFVSQWLRLTVFSVLALGWLALGGLTGISLKWDAAPSATLADAAAPAAFQGAAAVAEAQPAAPAAPAAKPTSQQLDGALRSFFTAESSRRTNFPQALAGGEAPFDIVFLSVCSMAWADLQASGLSTHPLFQNMDLVFDDFNSATSYSGPAALRLLRANCGQASHEALYRPADEHCHLFDSLRRLGFETQALLNHDGRFPGFVQPLGTVGKFAPPHVPTSLKPRLRSFDGSPIWGDLDTLSDWWARRRASSGERVALLYNTVTVHDGNREPLSDGGSRSAPFQTRAQSLLDGFNAFIGELEKSGRRVLVVLIPEHGAGLQGDRMQIPGMREIPSRAITRVPVAVRLVGGTAPHGPAVHVQGQTSYLALSELIARTLADDLFDRTEIDWKAFADGLPRTQPVSENEGSVLMSWGETPYVRIGKGAWIPYPK